MTALTDKYFDSAAAGGGNGSLATPYNSLLSFNNLNNIRANLKRGSVFLEQYDLAVASNFEIRDYGSALARPMILGADLFNSGWVLYSGTTYYHATVGLQYILYGPLGSLARMDFIASLAECAAAPFTQWWDTGTSRLYANFSTFGNPNGAQVRAPVRSAGATFTASAATNDVETHEVDFFGQRDYCISGNITGSGVHLHDMEMAFTGVPPSNNTSGGNGGWGPYINGVSNASRLGYYTLHNLLLHHLTKNAVETQNIDNYHAYNNRFHDVGMCFECYGIHGGRIEANVSYNVGFTKRGARNCFVGVIGDAATHTTNLRIAGNLAYNLSSEAVVVEDGDNVETINNTFKDWGGALVGVYGIKYQNAQGGVIANPTSHSNILMCKYEGGGAGQYRGQLSGIVSPNVPWVAVTGTVDRNCYWNYGSGGQTCRLVSWGAGDYYNSTQAAFNNNTAAYKVAAAIDGQEQNSINNDPLFVDADNGDFTLQAGSPARGLGANAWIAGVTKGRPACLHTAVAGVYTAGAVDDTNTVAGAVQARFFP